MSLLMEGLVSFSNMDFVEFAISLECSRSFLEKCQPANKISDWKLINIFHRSSAQIVYVDYFAYCKIFHLIYILMFKITWIWESLILTDRKIYIHSAITMVWIRQGMFSTILVFVNFAQPPLDAMFIYFILLVQ